MSQTIQTVRPSAWLMNCFSETKEKQKGNCNGNATLHIFKTLKCLDHWNIKDSFHTKQWLIIFITNERS